TLIAQSKTPGSGELRAQKRQPIFRESFDSRKSGSQAFYYHTFVIKGLKNPRLLLCPGWLKLLRPRPLKKAKRRKRRAPGAETSAYISEILSPCKNGVNPFIITL